jgi:hypothetical protein
MVNRIRRFDPYDTEEMAQILRDEGVISVVTDTVHGLCARMDSLNAQEKLRDIKHRPKDKAFPVMCCDLEQIESIACVNENGRKVIEAFMPGPVTVILEKRKEIPDFVNGGMPTLAIRMATSDALEKLILRAEELQKRPLPVTPDARQTLIELADGDGRYFISTRPLPRILGKTSNSAVSFTMPIAVSLSVTPRAAMTLLAMLTGRQPRILSSPSLYFTCSNASSRWDITASC